MQNQLQNYRTRRVSLPLYIYAQMKGFYEMSNEKISSDLFKANKNTYVINALALLSIALGLTVMLGWHIGSSALIQVFPTMAPMQYNTALGFLLSGAGLLEIVRERRQLGGFLGGLTFLIGILTILQYMAGFDLGIDRLFIEPEITTKTSHPGRMAPNTALCFTLSGLVLMLSGFKRALIFSLSITIFAMAAITLLGYMLNTEGVYGWGNLTRMALHTASGFVILSVGFMTFSLLKNEDKTYDFWNLAPFSIATIVAVLSLFSWYTVEESMSARNQEHFNEVVTDTQDVLKDRYILYEEALRGGLGLYYASLSVERGEWKRYVEALQIEETLPGINGVGYIDYVWDKDLTAYLKRTRADQAPNFKNHPETEYPDKFIIKFIEPSKRNAAAIGLDIGFEKNRREAAERARDSGMPALTEKILLVQDQKKQAGFLYLIPVYDLKHTPPTIEERRKHIQGWVYAPFIGSNFLSGLNKINNNELDFSVYDGTEISTESLIYSNDEDVTRAAKSDLLYGETQLKFAGRAWTILWRANDHYQTPSNNYLGGVILMFGLTFALFIYFTLMRLVNSRDIIAERVREQTKELKTASDFKILVANNIPDFIFVKDAEFRIVEANNSFLSLYPEDVRKTVLGTTTLESYEKKDADEFLVNDRKAFDEGSSEAEEEITFPNGDKRVLFTKKVRFENTKGETFILGISRDITDAKKAQEQILKSNVELERSNTELERFAHIASHDLQEPLRKITSFIDQLDNHLGIQLDDDARLYMDFVTSGAERMQALIKGLLQYSTLTKSEADIQKLDSAEVLTLAIDNLSYKIAENEAKITAENLPKVYYDKVMLTQLFQNLISNAIKYRSKQAPEIVISAKKLSEFWEFSVQDNGMGMDEKYSERIFEMFQRLHRKEDIPGTGIGLSLCQKIVERYGGKIWMTSKPDIGSTFFFTVPVKKSVIKNS
tara:strand:+ start:6304 stop:9144 length:2841 start_codon:yes stop_codon:yes gene_type:complete